MLSLAIPGRISHACMQSHTLFLQRAKINCFRTSMLCAVITIHHQTLILAQTTRAERKKHALLVKYLNFSQTVNPGGSRRDAGLDSTRCKINRLDKPRKTPPTDAVRASENAEIFKPITFFKCFQRRNRRRSLLGATSVCRRR